MAHCSMALEALSLHSRRRDAQMSAPHDDRCTTLQQQTRFGVAALAFANRP